MLRDIDFTVEDGEFVSIMGSSGSGKTSLLNVLGILDAYDSGAYYLDDKLIKNLPERIAAQYRNRFIGFVFQSFNLLGFKSALENVALPLYYQGFSRKARNKLALEYLDKVGSQGARRALALRALRRRAPARGRGARPHHQAEPAARRRTYRRARHHHLCTSSWISSRRSTRQA